jgi:hypothetical protein
MAVECDYCGRPYEPHGTRWLCPACGYKGSCCEGAPLDVLDEVHVPEYEDADVVVSLDELVAAGFDIEELQP